MRKKLIRVGIILGIIVLFTLTALYNSYVYKYEFLISLHFILTNILSGIWILISNPVIFISLLIIGVGTIYRRYIPDVLGRLEQAKGYGVELHFKETDKQFLPTTIKETKENIVAPNLEVAEKIINTVDISFCKFLLESDNIDVASGTFLKSIGDEHVEPSSLFERMELNSSDKVYIETYIKLFFGSGYLNVLTNFQGLLFNLDNIKDEKDNYVILSLYPEVKKLIYERLAREVETEKKPTPKPVE